MSKDKLQEKYDSLSDRLSDLEIKFIEPHQDPMEQPADYNLDVQSYCIMSHAAFEQFFEEICLYQLEKIQKSFNTPKRLVSLGTICLLHFDTNSNNLDDQWKDQDKINDYLASCIDNQKSSLSKYAITQNHGADLKYLKKLLLPVGIDIPHDLNHINSLNTLKDMRGTYAHTFNRAQKPMSPDDARNIVYDVYVMAGLLKEIAINMKYLETK